MFHGHHIRDTAVMSLSPLRGWTRGIPATFRGPAAHVSNIVSFLRWEPGMKDWLVDDRR